MLAFAGERLLLYPKGLEDCRTLCRKSGNEIARFTSAKHTHAHTKSHKEKDTHTDVTAQPWKTKQKEEPRWRRRWAFIGGESQLEILFERLVC